MVKLPEKDENYGKIVIYPNRQECPIIVGQNGITNLPVFTNIPSFPLFNCTSIDYKSTIYMHGVCLGIFQKIFILVVTSSRGKKFSVAPTGELLV